MQIKNSRSQSLAALKEEHRRECTDMFDSSFLPSPTKSTDQSGLSFSCASQLFFFLMKRGETSASTPSIKGRVLSEFQARIVRLQSNVKWLVVGKVEMVKLQMLSSTLHFAVKGSSVLCHSAWFSATELERMGKLTYSQAHHHCCELCITSSCWPGCHVISPSVHSTQTHPLSQPKHIQNGEGLNPSKVMWMWTVFELNKQVSSMNFG